MSDDRLGHPAAGDGGLLKHPLVMHIAHDRVPGQDDVAAAQHASGQQAAQRVPVLHVRQGPQGVAVLQEVRRVLRLPGLTQISRDVLDGVPLQPHRLGHAPRNLDLAGAGAPVGEGHRPVQGAVKRQPGREQARVQAAGQGQDESGRPRSAVQILQDPTESGIERLGQQRGELLGIRDHVGLLGEPRQGVVDGARLPGGPVDAHDGALLGLVDARQQRVGAGDETGVEELPARPRIKAG